jgi:hypothetical protein
MLALILAAVDEQINTSMKSDAASTVPFVRGIWAGAIAGSEKEAHFLNLLVRNLPTIAENDSLTAAKLSAEIWQHTPPDSPLKPPMLEAFDQYIQRASHKDLDATISLAREVSDWTPKGSPLRASASSHAERLDREGPKEILDPGKIRLLIRGKGSLTLLEKIGLGGS